eukprot:SAG25_NODE_1507_length_2873_cov_3.955299_5_plen_24_part_01
MMQLCDATVTQAEILILDERCGRT